MRVGKCVCVPVHSGIILWPSAYVPEQKDPHSPTFTTTAPGVCLCVCVCVCVCLKHTSKSIGRARDVSQGVLAYDAPYRFERIFC